MTKYKARLYAALSISADGKEVDTLKLAPAKAERFADLVAQLVEQMENMRSKNLPTTVQWRKFGSNADVLVLNTLVQFTIFDADTLGREGVEPESALILTTELAKGRLLFKTIRFSLEDTSLFSTPSVATGARKVIKDILEIGIYSQFNYRFSLRPC